MGADGQKYKRKINGSIKLDSHWPVYQFLMGKAAQGIAQVLKLGSIPNLL